MDDADMITLMKKISVVFLFMLLIIEASADMLALQTRQQLAINALSLATQADQSIFKLF